MINKVPEDKHFYFKELWLKQCEIIDWINSQGLVDGKPLIPPTHRTNGKVNNAIPDTQSPESTAVNVESRVASKDTINVPVYLDKDLIPDNRKGCGKEFYLGKFSFDCGSSEYILCEDCKVKE